MRQSNSRRIALGGMLAAAALVLMCLGGLIPVATYACPMLCCLTAAIVLAFCGKRIAWAWYAVVSLLSLLLGPDKEAAMIFLVIGYYTLIKKNIEQKKGSFLIKSLYFNLSILAAYWIISRLLGIDQIAQDNEMLGLWGLLLLLVLGNVTFFLLDRLLTVVAGKLR